MKSKMLHFETSGINYARGWMNSS